MEKKKKKYVPPTVELVPMTKEEIAEILNRDPEKSRSSDEKNGKTSKKSKV